LFREVIIFFFAELNVDLVVADLACCFEAIPLAIDADVVPVFLW
jgi:hypothetical protein